MTRAALARHESRGTHQRTDVPATDPAQAHHVAWSISQLDPVVPALGSAGVAAGHPK